MPSDRPVLAEFARLTASLFSADELRRLFGFWPADQLARTERLDGPHEGRTTTEGYERLWTKAQEFAHKRSARVVECDDIADLFIEVAGASGGR